MSKITPPPAMTPDQISLLRRQHTDEYDDFYFDKERFAKSIEDTRDQQWLDMLAQQADRQRVPEGWREFVAEVVASAESYERRTGQAVNAEWVKRGKELLAAAPEAPAQEKSNG